jgi:hypothetical protein
LYIEFETAMREFVVAYRLVGPRGCPSRGAAGPNLACVREAVALERAHDWAVERIDEIEAQKEIRCVVPRVDDPRIEHMQALERQLEEERRERLRELERMATEVGAIETPEPTRE